MSVKVVLEGGEFDGQEVEMDVWRARVEIKSLLSPGDYSVYVATRREIRGLEVFVLEQSQDSERDK